MRYLTLEIVRFFSEEAKRAFVAGPRQVGKTTLARHLLAQAGMEAFYFNWDIESHRSAKTQVDTHGLIPVVLCHS